VDTAGTFEIDVNGSPGSVVVTHVEVGGGQQAHGAQGAVHLSNLRCCSSCCRSLCTFANSICKLRTSVSILPNCCS